MARLDFLLSPKETETFGLLRASALGLDSGESTITASRIVASRISTLSFSTLASITGEGSSKGSSDDSVSSSSRRRKTSSSLDSFISDETSSSGSSISCSSSRRESIIRSINSDFFPERGSPIASRRTLRSATVRFSRSPRFIGPRSLSLC